MFVSPDVLYEPRICVVSFMMMLFPVNAKGFFFKEFIYLKKENFLNT